MEKARAVVRVETPFFSGISVPIAFQGVVVTANALPEGRTEIATTSVDQARLEEIVRSLGHTIKASVPEAGI
jgi:hypothetical protein